MTTEDYANNHFKDDARMTHSAFCSMLNCDMTGFWATAKLSKEECKRMKVREGSNFILTLIENMNDSSWFKDEYERLKKTGITGIANASDIKIVSIGARIEKRNAFQTELTGLFQLTGKIGNINVIFHTTGEASIDSISSADMFADVFSGTFNATLSMSNEFEFEADTVPFPMDIPENDTATESSMRNSSSLRSSFYNALSSFRTKG